MRLRLWKQVIFSVLFPIMIASIIVLYAVYSVGTISQRVTAIEIADDINLTLLELRRYEKNILLFNEDENIKKFYEYFKQIEAKVSSIEADIIKKSGEEKFKALLENMGIYKKSASSLISGIKTEQKLLEEIRPSGRIIEKEAFNKGLAFELRRHEKNFIIYREQQAADKLHQTAKKLITIQPSISIPVRNYLNIFNSLNEISSLKESLVEKMRHSGRTIEKTTMEFSSKKRAAIDKTISTSRVLLIASLLFIVLSTCIVVCLFSINAVRTLKILEQSFSRLKNGDFSRGIDINVNSAPEEIISFVNTYNHTIKKLGESRTELEDTLKKLEEANKELVQRQDELVEARKLTAMRLLASEIAHEINNPLSTLTTFLGMFYEDMQADVIKQEALELMLKEIGRCQTVLRGLVDFARKEPLNLKEISLVKLINEAIDIVNNQNLGKGINLRTSLNELPEKALVDAVLIRQALVNILTNAYQFTPAGKNIDIAGYTEDNNLVVVIRDEGTGISEEKLPYIFEPFFSTRKEIGGSGLGLAITKKIIERHNGNIHIESRLGEGTVFKIKLPINKE